MKSIRIFLAMMMVFLIAPTFSFAQNTIQEGSSAVLAELGVKNCTLTQTNRDVAIECDFTNGKGILPDIRYSVQLIKTVNDVRMVADEQVYPETLTLREGESLHKSISYTIPGAIGGEAELWVFVSNSEGLGLGMNMVGTVNNVPLDGQLEIIPQTCFITVNGEPEDTQYTLEQGVDINAGELLVAHCDVHNPGRASVAATAKFASFRRNAFGESVETPAFPYPTFAAAPIETEKVSFLIPLASAPQAYDAVLSLVTADGKTVSNSVAFHYVVRGPSATIQNILLDKDYYLSGQEARITASWSGSADGHRQSRFPNEMTDEQAKTFLVTIKDAAGMVCGESTETVPESKVDRLKPVTFAVPITYDCYDPVVSASVIDINGNDIVTKTVGVDSSVEPPEPVVDGGLNKSLLAGIIGGLVVLVLAIIGIWKLYRRKHTNIVASFFALFLLGSLFFVAEPAQAETLQNIWDLGTGGGEYCDEYGCWTGVAEIITTHFTINLNKTTYAPGETIQATGIFTDSICADGAHLGARLGVRNDPDGQTRDFSWNYDSTNVPQYASFVAPSTPGTYAVTFTGSTNGIGMNAGIAIDLLVQGFVPNSASYSIVYTVASACVPNQGSACYSSANICGATSAGTIQCDGSCSAGPQPADPADNCPADPGFQCPATACTPTTSGACGADNGLKIFSAPTRLCDQGTPSAVSGSGPWNWNCVGSGGGSTVSCSALVAAPLPTTNLSVNGSVTPPPVAFNGNLAVAWGSSNASTCSGSGAGWSTATLSGSQNVMATTNSVYTITCFNVDGAWAGSSVPVTVLPPPATGSLQVSINGGGWTSSDQTIDPGDTVSLGWSSTNATTCTGTGFSTGGATNSSGTSVTPPAPNSSTAYGISCTGAGGTGAGDTLTISVRPLPNFNQPSISPTPSTTFDPATGDYDSISVVFQTTNDGGSATKADASYQFQFDRGRDGYEVTQNGSLGTLAQGASVNRTQTVTGGIPFGNSRIRVAIDSTNAVNESNESDNVRVLDISLPPPDPQLSISADRIQLRNEETTVIRWSTVATYPTLSCTVTGPGMNVSPAPLTGNQTTQPITSKSEFTFKCTETTTGTTWTESVIVETQGVIQET